MTQTYYAVHGNTKDINITGNQFLDNLTLGLWDKIGIPRPLSESDAKLVARMLRNYAALQMTTSDAPQRYGTYFGHQFGYVQEGRQELRWIEEVATFFDESGGLTDEG